MEEAENSWRRAIAKRDALLLRWSIVTEPTERERATMSALYGLCDFEIAETYYVLEIVRRSQRR